MQICCSNVCVYQIFVLPLHQQVEITDYLQGWLTYPFGFSLQTYQKQITSKQTKSD